MVAPKLESDLYLKADKVLNLKEQQLKFRNELLSK
jgi:hypothetical protein